MSHAVAAAQPRPIYVIVANGNGTAGLVPVQQYAARPAFVRPAHQHGAQPVIGWHAPHGAQPVIGSHPPHGAQPAPARPSHQHGAQPATGRPAVVRPTIAQPASPPPPHARPVTPHEMVRLRYVTQQAFEAVRLVQQLRPQIGPVGNPPYEFDPGRKLNAPIRDAAVGGRHAAIADAGLGIRSASRP